MKDEKNASPFAALSSKEQMERWACWHSQHMEEKPTEPLHESVNAIQEPTESLFCAKAHHGQYDAVIRRMQKAAQNIRSYTSCASD